MVTSIKKKKTTKSSTHKMMDLIAIRDHSEKEIRKKLSVYYENDEIQKAIDYGKKHNWIPESFEQLSKLSEQFASQLQRKGKGKLAVNQKLKEKGLPAISSDFDVELKNALSLAKKKLGSKTADKKMKEKIGRFLIGRGFSTDIA
jgi:regulatory protein